MICISRPSTHLKERRDAAFYPTRLTIVRPAQAPHFSASVSILVSLGLAKVSRIGPRASFRIFSIQLKWRALACAGLPGRLAQNGLRGPSHHSHVNRSSARGPVWCFSKTLAQNIALKCRARALGIAAVTFGFRDRISSVPARLAADQNGGCEESPGSRVYYPNTACGQLGACSRGRIRRYTEGSRVGLDCQPLIVE